MSVTCGEFCIRIYQRSVLLKNAWQLLLCGATLLILHTNLQGPGFYLNLSRSLTNFQLIFLHTQKGMTLLWFRNCMVIFLAPVNVNFIVQTSFQVDHTSWDRERYRNTQETASFTKYDSCIWRHHVLYICDFCGVVIVMLCFVIS
jgi:hypothetical protein